MIKKYNTNSMTDHSRKLRGDTANAYNAKALAEGRIKRFEAQGPADLVDSVRAQLSEIKGSSNLSKIEMLLEFYNKNK